MASLSEAYPAPNSAAALNERAENPQRYDQLPEFVRHVKERRHVLGIVGGNEVSRAAGDIADLESDLLGITRPISNAAIRHHLPPKGQTEIIRKNPKMTLVIDASLVDLPAYQQWAYPAVMAPEPLRKETCSRPEKY
jgi:hypothetical protein